MHPYCFPPPPLGAAASWPPLAHQGHDITVRRIRERDRCWLKKQIQGYLGQSYPNLRYLEFDGVGRKGDNSGWRWTFGPGDPFLHEKDLNKKRNSKFFIFQGLGQVPGCSSLKAVLDKKLKIMWHMFIYLFNKYILTFCIVPWTMLCTKDVVVVNHPR